MFGTKVEIKLKKAEAGKWNRLESIRSKENIKNESLKKVEKDIDIVTPQVDAVDLSDI